MVRACVRCRYKVFHGGRVVTVFSARNYTGSYTNDSALLVLAPDAQGNVRVHIKQLHARQQSSNADL